MVLGIKGHIDYWDGLICYGWYKFTEDKQTIYLISDNGLVIRDIGASYERPDLISQNICSEIMSGFEFDLNPHDLYSKGIGSVKLKDGDGYFLPGILLDVKKPEIRSNIDILSLFRISGWAYDVNFPKVTVKLDVFINGKLKKVVKCNHKRTDVFLAYAESEFCGFEFDLRTVIDINSVNRIVIMVSGTDIVIKEELLVLDKFLQISTLVSLQNTIRNSLDTDLSSYWLNKFAIPHLIDQIRGGEDSLVVSETKFLTEKTQGNRGVDVIIPVYKGIQETINCIVSVYSVNNNESFNLTVINDSSPESDMVDVLSELQGKYGFRLLHNESNLGFVKTVNKGMSLDEKNDVLLLNSDTVVTNNWLDRILETAYSSGDIGTVTPFSNNATICSYPKFCQYNDLPTGVDLDLLSDIVYQVNKGEVVDLPTAHGFAMFIKRDLINEIGYFDEQKWGKGYGEENDFSLRASRLGWRNVLSPFSFVQHLGSVSFAESSNSLIENNLNKLNSIYPDYPRLIQNFIKSDPIRLYRNNISLGLINNDVSSFSKDVKDYKGCVVLVSLTIGGGTEVAANDMANNLLQEGYFVLFLSASKDDLWKVRSFEKEYSIDIDSNTEIQKLLEIFKKLDVKFFHFHHTLEFSSTIWDLPRVLNVPYDITIHDYYYICPRVNLIDENNEYCGEPNVSACNRCVEENGVHESSRLKIDNFNEGVKGWRSFFEEKLKLARKIITPSVDAKLRVLKYLKLEKIDVKYHGGKILNYKPKNLKDVEVLNVVFIGAIGPHKGLDILKYCAKQAYKFDLPIRFTVVGYTADDRFFDKLPNVVITGKYERKELHGIIEDNDCHVAALFSTWPETYSYTLDEAVDSNLHVACFDFGAIPERCPQALKVKSYKDILPEILRLKDI